MWFTGLAKEGWGVKWGFCCLLTTDSVPSAFSRTEDQAEEARGPAWFWASITQERCFFAQSLAPRGLAWKVLCLCASVAAGNL